jgi:hypothetical protein
MPRIIALCGLKRSGKDTAAKVISDVFNYQHVKFAGKLKDCCRLLFGLSDEQLEGHEKEVIDPRWGESPRHIMQFFGTELMQVELQRLLPNVGRSFWVKQLMDAHPNQRIVISDMRFQHEVEEVLKCDPHALIIRIERSCAPCDDTHCSEADVHKLPCHVVLVNNDTVEEFAQQVLHLMETVQLQSTR